MAGYFGVWVAAVGAGVANHLWQSTAFAVAAWLVTLALKANHARVRHAVWVVASVKFLVPFSLLMAAGNLLPHPKAAVAPVVYSAMDEVEEPFAGVAFVAADPTHAAMKPRHEWGTRLGGEGGTRFGGGWGALLPEALGVLWVVGAGVVLVVFAVPFGKVRRTMREAEVAGDGREWEILRRVEERFEARRSRFEGEAKTDAGSDEDETKNPGLKPINLVGHIRGVETSRSLPEAKAFPLLKAEAAVRGGIELRLSGERMEPGIFGIARPVLVWPSELSARMDDEHIEAVMAHELMHVRRRDNLTAALHMLVEAVFWFHPMVWWMERKMVKEREQACDEAVVAMGDGADAWSETYAESLLKTCRFCVESPVACVAGVTGADLKQRVVGIVTGRALVRMSWAKKAMLAAAAVGAVAAPVVLGQAKAAQRMMLAAIEVAPRPMRSAMRAMIPIEMHLTDEIAGVVAPLAPLVDGANEVPMRFEVASIRPAAPEASNGGRMRRMSPLFTDDGITTRGTPLASLLATAYEVNLQLGQLLGTPDWVTTQPWGIQAKVADSDVAAYTKLVQDHTPEGTHRRNLMLQAFLVERFKLKVHRETREEKVYSLVLAKGGLKAKPAAADVGASMRFVLGGGHFESSTVKIGGLAAFLATSLKQPVTDKTGVAGNYAITLDWQPDTGAASADDSGKPSLPTALEEQLGLKLVAEKGPVEVVVVDHIEKPSVDGAEVGNPTLSPKGDKDGAPAGQDGIPPARKGQNGAYVTMPAIKFDIIVFKRCEDTMRGSIWPEYGGDFLRFHCEPVGQLVYYAYTTSDHPFLMSGEPGWVSTDRYEFTGKVAPADADAFSKLDEASKRMMMRGMLADVLKLKVRPDPTPHAVYDLVIGKGELKMTPHKDQTITLANGKEVIQPVGVDITAEGAANYHGVIMTQFAEAIATRVGRQVIDKTNLTGGYDFKTFMPLAHYSPSMETSEDSPIPRIFDGVKALGLNLVSAKEVTGGLVVDHVERPPEN